MTSLIRSQVSRASRSCTPTSASTSYLRLLTTTTNARHKSHPRSTPSHTNTNNPLLCLRNAAQTPLQPHPHTRLFHSTPPRSTPIIDPLLQTTHTLLTTLHTTTSLPWLYTIPLFAFLIRLFLTFPLSIYTRRTILARHSLQPLLAAWVTVISNDVMKQQPGLGPDETRKLVMKRLAKKEKEISKRLRVQMWKQWLPPLVQLPIWLVVIETVRGMCGTGKGMLGLIFGRWDEGAAASKDSSADASASPVSASSESSTDPIMEIDPFAGTDTPLISDQALPTHPVIPPDPTFHTEGFPNWFPDLTAPDPLLLLPFLLSSIMFLNLLPHDVRRRNPQYQPTPLQRRLTTSLRIVALAAGPLTLNVPSGMLWYWISSSGFAFLQGQVLERWMPAPRGVRPSMRTSGGRFGLDREGVRSGMAWRLKGGGGSGLTVGVSERVRRELGIRGDGQVSTKTETSIWSKTQMQMLGQKQKSPKPQTQARSPKGVNQTSKSKPGVSKAVKENGVNRNASPAHRPPPSASRSSSGPSTASSPKNSGSNSSSSSSSDSKTSSKKS